MLNTTRPPFRMLAHGCEAFASSGWRHWRTPGDRQPDFVLRPCRPDASGTPIRGEVALDSLGPDDNHCRVDEAWQRPTQDISCRETGYEDTMMPGLLNAAATQSLTQKPAVRLIVDHHRLLSEPTTAAQP